MKRYKLLKDLPTIKAGEIFKETVTGYNEKNLLVRIAPLNAKSPRLKVQDIDNFDEWFEEVKEPTDSIHWKPKLGDKYWFTSREGSIVWGYWSGGKKDVYKWKTGEVYRTQAECKQARDRELAEVRLRRTSTFKPDFRSGNGGWVVGHDHEEDELVAIFIDFIDYGEVAHYRTRTEAEKSIEENREDWLIYFGIEEEI